MPSLDWPGSDGNVAEWNDISPRVGLTYALDEDRKTILRASFARYAGTMGTTTGNWANPVATSFLQYAWLGPNGPLTSADFVAQAPVTANGFTATSYLPTDAASDAFSGGIYLTNRDDFSRTFNGVEIGLVKRMSDKWMGRVAVSFNDWQENVGPLAIQNPTRHDLDPLSDGGQVAPWSSGSGKIYYTNAKWQLNANALYELPYGFEVAGSLFGRQGYPYPKFLSLQSGFDGFLNVLADGTNIDDDRLEDLWNLDLRLAKIFRVGEQVRVSLSAEMFNVLNGNTELSRVGDASSSVFTRLNEVLAPRIVRFGARVSF